MTNVQSVATLIIITRGALARRIGLVATLTRRALRVHAALSKLSGPDADVLQALIPFFGPILAVLNGRVFDPHVFAAGIKKLYGWRFTGDIARQFIEPLRKQGFLERAASTEHGSVYLVKFSENDDDTALPITKIVDSIIDEFVKFPPRVTDLLSYNRSRDQLKDILIRFLVSMDVVGEGAYSSALGGLDLDSGARQILEPIRKEVESYESVVIHWLASIRRTSHVEAGPSSSC